VSLKRLGCFVSPHGFGHAARCCAVIEALRERLRDLRCDIFTTVPEWFFTDSLGADFELHRLHTDVGMVQRGPLEEDPRQTRQAVERLLRFDEPSVADVARELDRLRCDLVLADISPLGVAAAHQAGIPSVLVENFTWDWIYQAYLDEEPELAPLSRQLTRIYAQVDLRIQAVPFCQTVARARQVAPIARRLRNDRQTTRARLGVEPEERVILLTMGGVGWEEAANKRRDVVGAEAMPPGVVLLLPGAVARPQRHGGDLTLPFRLPLPHPDLVAAADLIIGKLGYGTVAEAYQAGSPMAYLSRRRFPESAVLATFATAELSCLPLEEEDLARGHWIERLDELLSLRRRSRAAARGAEQAAAAILECFGGA
jgi:UDP:flavonoid glycosyltransferase YjiC (YdhE family)